MTFFALIFFSSAILPSDVKAFIFKSFEYMPGTIPKVITQKSPNSSVSLR